MCILGAAQEFVSDPPDSISGPKIEDAIKYFTISEKFSIAFLPDRVGTSDTTLPLRVRDFMLPYTKLEFSVWKNGRLLENWKPVSSLGPETKYAVSFKNTQEDNLYKRWKTFQAGEYQLKRSTKKGYGLDLVDRRIRMINGAQPGRISMQVKSSEKGTETTFMLKDWI